MIFSSKTQIPCRSCGHRFNGKLKTSRATFKSAYCSRCYCRSMSGGRMCRNPRVSAPRGQYDRWSSFGAGAQMVGDSPYCAEHLTCHDHSNGLRCMRFVKKNDPDKFHFCDAHSCASPDCSSQKGSDHSCCADHRCSKQGCSTPRPGRNVGWCPTHTCEVEHCTSECAGEGPPRSAGRLCEHHRHCSASNCTQHCHRRDNGEYATLCGRHYCRFPGCSKQQIGFAGTDNATGSSVMHGNAGPNAPGDRVAGWPGFCQDHACVSLGCGNARVAVALGGQWCHVHECDVLGCRYQKIPGGSKFCREHVCQRRHCPRKADENGDGFCTRHRGCAEAGCNRDRYVEDDVVNERCDRHYYVPCHWTRCAEKPVPESAFCEEHVCAHRTCRDGRVPGSPSVYCGGHTCAAEGCYELRRHATLPDGAMAIGGGPNGHGLTSYCSNHCCHSSDCGDRCADGKVYCSAHNCAVDGCREKGTVNVPPQTYNGRIISNNNAKVCETHYIREDYRRIGQSGIGNGGGGGGGGGEYGPDMLGRLLGLGGRGGRERGIHIIADSPNPFDEPVPGAGGWHSHW
ncbi:hypothetical protein MCOR02_007085 [Pyricularia oryzae]|uniref:Uncharacterized protein n=2 Tax=Pyricularia TaxID=48558 RepID=A0ABQ8NJ39_PYRGI|nr:hypothetical protein MCOR02_007085 [Pyricularia oryzae]KAI6297827.1 hypothetical protein MCOR33_005920 [Pyricularia grisea]KAI6260129.1 hypothetical protein MCOR19_003545 [Pyricularia oryzae]KAI6287156.1 hypothetical protein MCOR26_000705 [Pyricularia oryzae]KAI6309360.1 hypothetical protein MCOR29_008960 [Pyricularia oryzae]